MKPEWGTKRACHKCAAHFYDLNKADFKCPKCEAAYTPADFTLKHAKAAEGPGKKETRKKSVILPLKEQIENIDVEIDANIEEEDLIEDTADLDDDDVPNVAKHEDDRE